MTADSDQGRTERAGLTVRRAALGTPDDDEDTAATRPTSGRTADRPSAPASKSEAVTEPLSTDSAPTEPIDPWARFAPDDRAPGPVRRVLGGLAQAAGHEWTLVSIAGLLLAALMTWPTLRHPGSTIPQDIYDPLLQAWQVAWGGHALLTDPLQLWNSNTFYPDSNTLAFSDSLLGYAPLGMLARGPVSALVVYNVLYVLAYALAFVGMYALCRQLGTRRPAAAMAGAAFAYAPWRLAHGGHLNILSTGGIALALAMLARGHGFRLRHRATSIHGTITDLGGYQPQRTRWGWALGGWLVAAWQITLGFGFGLPFGYVLGLVVVVGLVAWLLRRPRFPLRLLLADVGGLVVLALTCLYMGLPYLHAVAAHPNARRTLDQVGMFSPPWQGFFIAPSQSWLWGDAHADARQALPFQPEMTLLVGMVLLAFALFGMFFSVWRLRARLLLAAGVALTVVLAMGTGLGGGRYTYQLLYDYLPAWDAIRTPGRLVVWTTLLLALLAAGAVSALALRADEVALSRGRNPRRLGPVLGALLAIPLVLVLIEGVNRTPHPVVPTEPAALHNVAGPVLILPTDQLSDEGYMYWSTDGFPTMVNGGSGVQPAKQNKIRQVAAAFPDPHSVTYLEDLGVRTVVVLRDRVAGTPYQDAITRSYAGLGVHVRDTGQAVVFTLPSR